jgi:hypothetical protein
MAKAKLKAKQKAVSTSEPASKSVRPYPSKTLEEAIKIPIAIREKNNGNPWATEDVAKAAY